MKHRLLAATPPSEVRDATVRRLRVLARVGVRRILEFREQGPAGVARSRAAARAAGFPGLLIFGRPAATPSMDGERRRLARLGDGIGISSLRDVGRAEFGALSRAAHDAGKPFAVHVSEGVREPIDVVLAARPDLLIHACAASSGDLEVVARRRVPLVFCPTSNRHFRLRPPIAAAERLGIAWYLGTDNAMLASPGPLYEARLARRLVPGLPDASLLRALTTSPKKALKNVAPVERASASHSLVVLPTSRTGGVRWNARERVLRW